MTTNIEAAKMMVSGMNCLLNREQIHGLAEILTCKKYKKGSGYWMKVMCVVLCSILKRIDASVLFQI